MISSSRDVAIAHCCCTLDMMLFSSPMVTVDVYRIDVARNILGVSIKIRTIRIILFSFYRRCIANALKKCLT